MKAFHNNENRIVKESIFSALMILMQKNSFASISITEITKKAGVSRMAYYRNYESKEDIIVQEIDELFEDYKSQVISERNDVHHAAMLYFSYFRNHKIILNNLIQAGLSSLMFRRYDQYLEILLQNFDYEKSSNPKEEQYIIEFVAGGLYKILMAWAEFGMKESDEYMANIVTKLFRNSFIS